MVRRVKQCRGESGTRGFCPRENSSHFLGLSRGRLVIFSPPFCLYPRLKKRHGVPPRIILLNARRVYFSLISRPIFSVARGLSRGHLHGAFSLRYFSPKRFGKPPQSLPSRSEYPGRTLPRPATEFEDSSRERELSLYAASVLRTAVYP